MARSGLADSAPYIAEFLGTFVLVLTIGCNQLAGVAGNPAFAVTSIACALMIMVYSLGNISGGHLNPSVSLAVALSGKMSVDSQSKYESADIGGDQTVTGPRSFLEGSASRSAKVAAKLFSYVLAQVLGGLFAGLCFCQLYGKQLVLKPASGRTWWEAGMCETLYTAMLCLVVLNTALADNNKQNHFYGLAIGFVIIAGGYACGSISGAAFNPAVVLGINISSFTMDGLRWCLPYCAFHLVGAILATLLFRLVRPEDFAVAMVQAPQNIWNLEYRRPAPLTTEALLSTKLASEFIGTFMLVLTVGLNILAGSKATAWSAAASLMCMIYALGDVSGAHFNPAVTIAVAIIDRARWSCRQYIPYVVVQLLAGTLAGFLFSGLHDGETFGMGPKAAYTAGAAHMLEFIFTFVIALAVLSTSLVKGISSGIPRNFYFGLAIGSCVTAGGVASGNVSGGALNPAVSFGIATVHAIQDGGSLFSLLSFSLVQLAGGIAAAIVFAVTHEAELHKLKSDDVS
jgi:aquaporin Z